MKINKKMAARVARIARMSQTQKDLALCRASLRGDAEYVRALLQVGADAHADDDYAIRAATTLGHADVVRELQVAMEATRG